jgi:uncharacterized protein (TIGR03663 family)
MQRKLSFTRYAGFLLILLILTIISRFLFLTNKPIHFDEGINGWFVMQMKLTGFYKYDPTNYHGPLHFYILALFEYIMGRSVETLRAVPAFFGVLSVIFVCLDLFATRKMRMPLAIFLLLSPAFIFFGRSGIHEMPFVFFQLVMAAGLLRWIEGTKDSKAFSLVIIGLWGMMLLKETFAVSLFAWGVAYLTLGWTEVRALFLKSTWAPVWNRKVRLLSLGLVAGFVLFFTGFMLNPHGFLDFFIAFLPWMKTGTHGNGHEKELFYWLKVLVTAEPLVLLGIATAVAGIFTKNKAFRAVSVFALVQLLVYSLIPYKTVWCIVTLVWGFYFSLAYALVQWKNRIVHVGLIVLTVVLSVLQFKSTYESNYKRPINMEHPYVYVNSTYELKNFVDFLAAQFKAHPGWNKETIQVGMREQWPWPWIFHAYPNLDYNVCGDYIKENSLVYLCDLVDMPKAESKFTQSYLKVIISFRQAKESSVIYLRAAEFEPIYPGPFLKLEAAKKGTP